MYAGSLRARAFPDDALLWYISASNDGAGISTTTIIELIAVYDSYEKPAPLVCYGSTYHVPLYRLYRPSN